MTRPGRPVLPREASGRAPGERHGRVQFPGDGRGTLCPSGSLDELPRGCPLTGVRVVGVCLTGRDWTRPDVGSRDPGPDLRLPRLAPCRWQTLQRSGVSSRLTLGLGSAESIGPWCPPSSPRVAGGRPAGTASACPRRRFKCRRSRPASAFFPRAPGRARRLQLSRRPARPSLCRPAAGRGPGRTRVVPALCPWPLRGLTLRPAPGRSDVDPRVAFSLLSGRFGKGSPTRVLGGRRGSPLLGPPGSHAGAGRERKCRSMVVNPHGAVLTRTGSGSPSESNFQPT